MPSPAASSPSPLPPPTPAATRRRRRRQLLPPSSSSSAAAPTSASATSSSSSGSSSSSSSASSGALSFFSPAPSPFHHRFLSPLRSSAVPFSWEHRPGIPKTPARQLARAGKNPAAKALPLPPSLLSSKSKVSDADDPFVSGDYFIVPNDDTKNNTAARWRRRRRRQQQQRRRPPALAATLTDWLAVLSLYRSCTRSSDCLAAGTPPPRPPPPEKIREVATESVCP